MLYVLAHRLRVFLKGFLLVPVQLRRDLYDKGDVMVAPLAGISDQRNTFSAQTDSRICLRTRLYFVFHFAVYGFDPDGAAERSL